MTSENKIFPQVSIPPTDQTLELSSIRPNPTPKVSSSTPSIDEKTLQDAPTVDIEQQVSENKTLDASKPPDGGLQAWMVVIACACCGYSTFGFANAYGVFQAYYTETLDGATQSSVAWVGSLQYCLVFLPGLLSGHLTDQGYFKLPLAVGSVVLVAGIFLVAECTALWQLVLCQGIAVGVASGFLFLPSLAVIPQWFDKKRARAYGVVAVGSSIGGSILPIIIRKLLPAVGFKWTIRILGFIVLVTITFFNLAIKQRVKPIKKEADKTPMLSLFKNPVFTVYTLGLTLTWLGLYAPLQFFDVSAQHIGISKDLSFYTIVTANAASAVGRVSSGFWADSFGCINVLILFSLISALMAFVWPYAQSFPSLLVVAAIYGISSGAFISLLPASTSHMFPGSQVGRAIGLSATVMSLGALFGNPIAGQIASASGGYKAVGGYAGGVVLLSCVTFTWARYLALGHKWRGKF